MYGENGRNWMIDHRTGVVYIPDVENVTLDGSGLYLTFYKYVGGKGVGIEYDRNNNLTVQPSGGFISFGSKFAVGKTNPSTELDVSGSITADGNVDVGIEKFHKETKIVASDRVVGDLFRVSVAIDGNYAIVGAETKNSQKGAAYIFDVTSGTQLHKLTANDRSDDDYFGVSVAISGKYAIVGASLDDDRGNNSGSVYIFNVQTGEQIRKRKASDGASNDYYGTSVAISGNYAIVGAYNENGGRGAAYILGSSPMLSIDNGNNSIVANVRIVADDIVASGNVDIRDYGDTTLKIASLDTNSPGIEFIRTSYNHSSYHNSLIYGDDAWTDWKIYNTGGNLRFQSRYRDGTNSNATQHQNDIMHLNGTGNVGIGTTGPVCKLDVNYPEAWLQHNNSAVRSELAPSDYIASFRPASDSADAYISVRASGEANKAGIYFGTPSNTYTPNKCAIIAEGGHGYSKSKLHFCFAHNNDNLYGQATISSSEGASRMTITHAGNVGIGATSPSTSYKLEVAGSTRITGGGIISQEGRGIGVQATEIYHYYHNTQYNRQWWMGWYS